MNICKEYNIGINTFIKEIIGNKKNPELTRKVFNISDEKIYLGKQKQISNELIEKIYLTKIEYMILEQLLLNPKEIITKTKLIQLLNKTNNNNFLSCTQKYDENSLKVHISNIRKKIRNITNNEYIESVWGIGFKLCE